MTLIQNILAVLLVLGGTFFLAVSCLGLIRLPGYYCRNHAVGKSETLGIILVLAGLGVYNGLTLTTFKLILILIFVMIANPTATHVMLRAALRSGLQPWTLKTKQGDAGAVKEPEKSKTGTGGGQS